MDRIPVSKMLEGERQKLVHMEDRISERVVGQQKAIAAVADAADAPAAACRIPTG